jgi:hypothetical protein
MRVLPDFIESLRLKVKAVCKMLQVIAVIHVLLQKRQYLVRILHHHVAGRDAQHIIILGYELARL